MKLEETVVEIQCQKCPAPVTVTPIIEFKGPVKGTLYIPYLLYCAECGAVMTITRRKRRDDEKSKKE